MPKQQDDRQAKLDEVMKKLNKTYGAESVLELGDADNINIEWVPTGSFGLDYVLGGGFPKGRIVEISGAQSSGKSVMALFFIAKAQRDGLKCAFIDAEHAFSTEFAQKIGVNTDELIFNAPITGEEGLTVVEELVETGAIDVIVVDSVASLTPEKELEGELAKQDMALQAKLLAKFLRRVTANVAKNGVILIMLNQLRDNFSTFGFGPTTKTPGGHSLKFYASIRLSVSKMNKIKKGEEVVGNDIKIKADKNKVGNPFRECNLSIIYDRGIDTETELIEWAEAEKLISKTGTTYYLKNTTEGETKMGVGKDQAATFLVNNKQIADNLRDKIKVILDDRNAKTKETKTEQEDVKLS